MKKLVLGIVFGLLGVLWAIRCSVEAIQKTYFNNIVIFIVLVIVCCFAFIASILNFIDYSKSTQNKK